MTRRHHLSDPWLMLRTSIFRDFEHFLKSGPMFQYFPSRYRHGTCTIGKSIKTMRNNVEYELFDELGALPLGEGGGAKHSSPGHASYSLVPP